MTFDISGIQEAQQANQQAIAAARPSGAMGRAVQGATIEAQRYAISITHIGRYRRGGRYVGGGALRSSHRVGFDPSFGGSARGTIFIDPSSVNPVTRQRPAVYGKFEHRRGFPHNFYERTVNERGARIAQEALQEIQRALPHG